MSLRHRWLSILIVALALVLRLAALDFKPAHFDEGINGSFVDTMRADGCYHYDPANYHGPLHFYVSFASQQLFGRSAWALRLPTALIGAATVALMLAFRRFLPWRAVWIAAMAAAISPAMVFYSRYAIHETWLPFFTLLAVHGGFGIANGGRRIKDLWALALGMTGMVLTKETYIVHWIAAALAISATHVLEKISPIAPARRRSRPADLFRAPKNTAAKPPDAATDADAHADSAVAKSAPYTSRDIAFVAAACAAIIILFYSGFGLAWKDWEDAKGIFETFTLMVKKGTTDEQGHNKEFFYWLKLLGWYEWPALIGLLAAPVFALRRSPILAAVVLACTALLAGKGWLALHALAPEERLSDYLKPNLRLDCLTSAGLWFLAIGGFLFSAAPARNAAMRWLCLYGLGSLTAYSLIPYKTPWCIINLLWPFFFALGQLAENICKRIDRRLIYVGGAMLAIVPLSDVWKLNFRRPTEDGGRYVYVQTTFDINKLLHPIRDLLHTSAAHRQMRGIVLMEPYPLLWQLNDFPNIEFPGEDGGIEQYDADFLLVPIEREEEIESRLLGIYFKERYRQRAGASDGWLYLSAERFLSVLPNRTPEFRPRVAQPNPNRQPDMPRP